ncbi:MAG: hypothetical protein JOY80_10410 [Candidatus Dormibacteraeota bacterium]|nr:hypothetical protein [Candidatus Dormibacteraeota bacterium]
MIIAASICITRLHADRGEPPACATLVALADCVAAGCAAPPLLALPQPVIASAANATAPA